MDIASKVTMLILMQSVLTAAESTGCICSDATNCPAPYAKLQTISPNQSVTFELYNSSKYINQTTLRWCVSGVAATNVDKFVNTFTERGTNLTYNNPYPDDKADGLTLYLVDGDCAQPLRAILINSLDGNFTKRYFILLHVDKVSRSSIIVPSITTQSICYTSTIYTTKDATKCIQTNTLPADTGGASMTETKMTPNLSSTPTQSTSSVLQINSTETASSTSLSTTNIQSTAYPTPTSTRTIVTGEEQTELISGISLGAILAIVICLYALTTIILVLRIKILSGNARQQSPVDCTSYRHRLRTVA